MRGRKRNTRVIQIFRQLGLIGDCIIIEFRTERLTTPVTLGASVWISKHFRY